MLTMLGGIFFIFVCVVVLIGVLMPDFFKKYSDVQKVKAEKTAYKLDNMFVDIKLKKLHLAYVAAPLLLAVGGYFLLNNLIGSAIGIAIGVILPAVVMKQMKMARLKKFESQLVDGLMILSGSLKAGLSLLQSFEALVEEMPAPISQEFNLVLRESKIGVNFEECLLRLKKRMPCDDLNLIVTSILVARETGGDLTETFYQLIYAIREKAKLEGRVKALTVQGKLQGIIMGILPIVFAFLVYSMNNKFFDVMLRDRMGQMLLVYAVFSYLIGLFILLKLSKVDI